MRIVAAGFPDALGLKKTGERWFTESGDAVEFEFMVSDAPIAAEVRADKALTLAAVAEI